MSAGVPVMLNIQMKKCRIQTTFQMSRVTRCLISCWQSIQITDSLKTIIFHLDVLVLGKHTKLPISHFSVFVLFFFFFTVTRLCSLFVFLPLLLPCIHVVSPILTSSTKMWNGKQGGTVVESTVLGIRSEQSSSSSWISNYCVSMV